MNTTSTKPPRAGWARAKRKRSCTQYTRRVQHRSLRIIFHQAKFKKCTWKRPSCAYAGRNVRPGCARLRRAYQQRLPRVRAPSARISAAPAPGARLRRAYQQRLPRVRAPPARISAAPALGARASGAHISSACPGCARLRRACQRGYASGVQAGGTPALLGAWVPPRCEQLPQHSTIIPAPLSPAPATRRRRRRCPVARRCWRPSHA